jgi:hypothetical protein
LNGLPLNQKLVALVCALMVDDPHAAITDLIDVAGHG